MDATHEIAASTASPPTSTPAWQHINLACRIRHTVAVVLVADGQPLAAQHRLGHRDLSTTLRHYGWAQAPDDTDIADHLDAVLNGLGAG